jgi:hypothetical protein
MARELWLEGGYRIMTIEHLHSVVISGQQGFADEDIAQIS